MIVAMARSRAGVAIQRGISEKHTQASFGRAVGRSQTWVSQSLLDDTEATLLRIWVNEPDLFARILEVLEWTPVQFERETGMTLPQGLPGVPIGGVPLRSGDDADTTYAEPVELAEQKRLLIYSAAGAGPGEDDGEVVGHIYINVNEPGDVVYEVNGHSMEPEIPHGSKVFVERDKFDLGDIVVAYVPDAGGMVVKRLVADKDNHRAILASKNPDYGALIADGAHIVGRVVSYMKKLDRKR